jgi:hypothetical protein
MSSSSSSEPLAADVAGSLIEGSLIEPNRAARGNRNAAGRVEAGAITSVSGATGSLLGFVSTNLKRAGRDQRSTIAQMAPPSKGMEKFTESWEERGSAGLPPPNCRKRCAIRIKDYAQLTTAIDTILSILAVYSCVNYVLGSYQPEVRATGEFHAIEVIMTALFALDVLLKLFVAYRPFQVLFSPLMVIDILALVPVVEVAFDNVSVQRDGEILPLTLALLRTLRILRIFRLNKLLGFHRSRVWQEIYRMVLTVVMGLVFYTAVIQVIENYHADNSPGGLPHREYHEYFYFLIVTVSTVGYGDVAPRSMEGQMLVIFMIFTGAIYLSNASSEAIRLSNLVSRYKQVYYAAQSDTPHVVVTGALTVSGLRDFLHEAFHSDHDCPELQVVLLSAIPPSDDIKSLINRPGRYTNSIT